MNAPRTQFDDDATEQDGKHPSPANAFHEAVAQLGEFKQYALHFLAARIDSAKLTVRNAVLWMGIGIIGLLGAVAVVVTAVVILCVGMAQAIAALCGGRMWAGNIIVGVVLLGAIVVGIWLGVKRMFGASLTKTVERYERKLRRQRIDLGHDARERTRRVRR